MTGKDALRSGRRVFTFILCNNGEKNGGSIGIIEYKKDNALCIITMNRPNAMNAINAELGNALLKALIEAEYDKEVRALLQANTLLGTTIILT